MRPATVSRPRGGDLRQSCLLRHKRRGRAVVDRFSIELRREPRDCGKHERYDQYHKHLITPTALSRLFRLDDFGHVDFSMFGLGQSRGASERKCAGAAMVPDFARVTGFSTEAAVHRSGAYGKGLGLAGED